MKNPLISIIVPCYNVEKYVAECLKSIVEQSYENLEIIVVNDGSTDNTEREIFSFLDDKRLKYIVQENQGLSGARNTGLDNMQGEYVCFVDSDDFIHPDFVRTLYQNLVENDADISICGFYWYWENEKLEKDGNDEISVFSREEMMKIVGLDDRSIVAWNKLYKKDLFNDLRFALGRVHEDEFLVHHIVWKAYKLVMSGRKLYYYRQREDSIMNSTYTDKKLKDAIDAIDDRIAFCQEHRISEKERFIRLKWHYLIYENGLLDKNLDYAKTYILTHPLEFFRKFRMRKKDKIKLYLKLLKEKIKK